MKKQILALTVTALLPMFGHARDALISQESGGYPSPASMHLEHVQNRLGDAAVKECGGLDKVVTLKNINISITSLIEEDQGVATVVPGQHGLLLDLGYQRIKASATVVCL